MPAGYETLSVLRVSRLMRALADVRTLPGNYRYLPRTPVVPAEEGEIMARWIDRDQIADLVTDDARAAVYTSGKFSLETTEVPNIKHGRSFTQSQINTMRRVAAGAAMAEDRDNVKEAMFAVGDKLLRGIRDRMEQLCVAMRLDSFSYNRGGLVIPNLTWGMPNLLNTVAGTAWFANPTTATPVDNIFSVKLIMNTVFNVMADRVTMTTPAFRAMIATAEFQAKAKTYLPSNLATPLNFSLMNLEQQQGFAGTVLGMKVELYDLRNWSQDNTGAQGSAQNLPDSKVLIEASEFDGDPGAWDFANAVVTESILSAMLPNTGTGGGIPGMIGSFQGGERGPVGYCTVPSDLNPPNITMWGVARGFPRKHLLQANAVIDIGAVTNPIPVTEQF